jgi:hypothetical protein
MYAAYHIRIKPIAWFTPRGEILVAETAKNKLILKPPSISWPEARKLHNLQRG